MAKDRPQWLNAYPTLANIDDPAWLDLLNAARPVSLSAGATVFRDGSSCSNYLLIHRGSVRVQKVAENGREIVLYRVQPGQTCILTTTCLMATVAYPAEAVTETEVDAITIPATAFHAALGGSAQFRQFVFNVYSQRVNDLILLVEEVAFGRMDRRLAQLLCQESKARSSIELTHQAIATELGTAREVVSRLLKEFERRGWVALSRGRIEIIDAAALTDVGHSGFM